MSHLSHLLQIFLALFCHICYICDMADLNLRGISDDTVRRLKVEAAETGSTLKDCCERRLKMWSVRQMEQAHSAVAQAKAKGELIPQPCEVCGTSEKIEAHHEDYDKPLEVMWLCRIHHKARHGEIGHLVDWSDNDTTSRHVSIRLPADLADDLERESVELERPLSWVIVKRLRDGVGGVRTKTNAEVQDGDADRGSAGGVAAGERGGSGNGKPVPVLREAKVAANDVRPVHPVRDELAGRGEHVSGVSGSGSTDQPACPVHGRAEGGWSRPIEGWWCIVCRKWYR